VRDVLSDDPTTSVTSDARPTLRRSKSTHINVVIQTLEQRRNGTYPLGYPLKIAHSTSDRLDAISTAGS
jgi:hypothetical protein